MKLEDFPLLGELLPEERERVNEELETETVPKGRAVFEQGEEGDALLLVLEGELVLQSREHGEVGRLCAGSVLGALSVVTAGRREVSALAAVPTTVAWLDRAAFRRLVVDSPPTACKLLEAMLRDFVATVREGLPSLAASGG